MAIDYHKEDFTKNGRTYEIILDVVGKTRFPHCKNSLNEDGSYLNLVMVMEGPKRRWYHLTTGKNVIGGAASKGIIRAKQNEALVILKELVEAEKIIPIIDRTYPFEQMAEAHRYVDKGHKKGNVAITLRT